MNFRPATTLLAGMAFLAVSAFAETTFDETRSTLEKWVETRQLISKTRSDWQSDRELLEQTIALYERELSTLNEKISKVQTNSAQAIQEMAAAESLQRTSNEALDAAARFATAFEKRIGGQVPKLPLPLQDILKPLLSRMPADPANTKAPAMDRVQVCCQVLNELDKFNNAIGVFSEKRKNAAGDEVSVQTLYVGLGAAYFVNDTGDFAGSGIPGPNGWEWTTRPDLASAVSEAIKMYRNERTAQFVSLPVVLK